MLVLTRKIGEKLVIGNEIVVEVLEVSGDGVRLGIGAPRETSIHRHEVFMEIQKANEAASSTETPTTSIEDLAAKLRAQDEK
jgi:carbon storage regulator